MLEVRHHPELATPELWAYLRPLVGRLEDGPEGQRRGVRLVENTPLSPPLLAVALAVYPTVAPDAWVQVTVQFYGDGRAHTSCHTDLGAAGDGFVLNLGATRTFRVHRVPDGTRPREGCGDRDLDARAVRLQAGDVAIMSEAFHAGWHHQVPPEPDVTGERMGLVFRQQPRM